MKVMVSRKLDIMDEEVRSETGLNCWLHYFFFNLITTYVSPFIEYFFYMLALIFTAHIEQPGY